MSYVDDNLVAGENVMYRAHLHWVLYITAVLAALLVIAVGLALAADKSTKDIAWFFFVLAPLPLIRPYLLCRFSEFAVTDKRVLVKTGILNRHTLETLLTKVENISVDQSLGGRMLNYGTITVTGTGGTKEQFARIAAPLEFRKQIQAATLKYQEQR
ncbi:MAG: PH domain-containing protein [Nitrospirae bacterium]|nr:MAG: PH domain-containing protein [Nitrospirota bacterium]